MCFGTNIKNNKAFVFYFLFYKNLFCVTFTVNVEMYEYKQQYSLDMPGLYIYIYVCMK